MSVAPDSLAGPSASTEPAEQLQRLALRSVHRALSDLRRGVPVLLDTLMASESAGRPLGARLAVLAAEGASAAGLAEFEALTAGPATLLLAPVRAATVLRRPVPEQGLVALQASPALLRPHVLHGFADPTAEQFVGSPPATVAALPGSAAAMLLVKLARLLPACLVAPSDAIEPGLVRLGEAEVLGYQNRAAGTLRRVADAAVPLEGVPDARVVAFRAADSAIEHLAVIIGRPELLPADAPAPLVRLHSECFTGDLLGSLRCDCGPQLRQAVARMAAEGSGALLYLAQEGRGIGLVNKLRAYTLQDVGLDTVDANRALGWGDDERSFLVAAAMLDELGVHRVRLLTDNPYKLTALQACGVSVEGRVSAAITANGINDAYLATKTARLGHLR